MSAESALVALLEGDAAVTAIVSSHIYPDAVPQGDDNEDNIPAITYERTDTDYVQTIHGPTVGDTVGFDVTCISTSRAAADDLADKVKTALANGGFIIENRSGAFDLQSDIWGAVLSVSCNE